MTLKAVLFDFNGVIINDEWLHQELLEQLLIAENLRPDPNEFREVCVGRRDRDCLRALLERRGRVPNDANLDQLLRQKAQTYRDRIDALPKLPIYPGVEDFIYRLRVAHIPMAIVTGAGRTEVDAVLTRAGFADFFTTVVSGEEVGAGKPAPDGYLLAVDRLQSAIPTTHFQSDDCLVIEDSYPGIAAAKAAGMQVVGVANSHPFQMMQRRANWAVDYLHEVELERLMRYYEGREREVPA